jgi:hypothetical protein
VNASGRILTVVEVRHTVGQGTGADPAREIVEYFDADGALLATHDAWLINTAASQARELYAELQDTLRVLSGDADEARSAQQRLQYAAGGVGRCVYLLDGRTGR